jgi:hypothetical protein
MTCISELGRGDQQVAEQARRLIRTQAEFGNRKGTKVLEQ